MIWIIGGTTETGALLELIRGKLEYIITVATPEGGEILADRRVRIARMDYPMMLNFIQTHEIDRIVDLSHPYASDVTQNARRASEAMNVPYLRFVRPASSMTGAVSLPSIEACCEYLKTVQGCVFFTTGSKNIKDFEPLKGENRFIYRILPASASLAQCSKQHVALKDIVAVLGPLSERLNIAMFQEYEADYVVMKDSGQAGGTPAKLNACRHLGITPVVIGRPEDVGVSDLEILVAKIFSRGVYSDPSIKFHKFLAILPRT